jgi:hypothetical protein
MTRAGAVIAAAVICACGSDDGPSARLSIPATAPTRSATTGLQPLRLGGGRDGVLYVPTSYVPGEPLPLLILLHGAGGGANDWFGSYAQRAEDARFVMLGHPVAAVPPALGVAREIQRAAQRSAGVTAFDHRGEIENRVCSHTG